MSEIFSPGDIVVNLLEETRPMLILSKSTKYEDFYTARYLNRTTGLFVVDDFFRFELTYYKQ